MSENETGKKVFLLKKKYLVLIAVVLAVVTAAALILFTASSSDELNIFYSGAQTGAIVVRNGRTADGVLTGKSVSSVRYSLDKSDAAVLMSEGSAYTLYYTDGKNNSKISSGCTNDYVISLDGKKVMYSDSEKGLYIFDAKTKKTVSVDTQVGSFCLSPSGDTAVYVKNESPEAKMYIYNGSVSKALPVVYTPLSVSDDGNFIFAVNGENSLYVLDGNGNVTSKICSSVSADKFYISADVSGIVFSDGSYTYISQQGKSRVRLMSYNAVPVNAGGVTCDSGSITSVCDSLVDVFYSVTDENSTETLFYFDSDCNRSDVAGNVKNYVITGTQSLVYLDAEGKIYRYVKGRTEFVVSGAAEMLCDSKGKYIYYRDAAHNLYAVKQTAPVLLSNGFEKMYITNDDVLLFVMADGRLYSVEKDRNAKLSDENVYGCICGQSVTFCVKNYNAHTGKFELYVSLSGDNFRLIHENISNIV